MGTTLLAVVLQARRAYWISVGDSLLLRLRRGQLTRLNANHSYAEAFEQAVADGEISAQAARGHPDYHLLTSALTGDSVPLIDCPEAGIDWLAEDRLLLASDGILSLAQAAILEVLQDAETPQQAAEALILAVEDRADPEQDNCTVVTLFAGE